MNAAQRASAAMNRLAKWRGFFAGWTYGTRALKGPLSGPVRASRDAAERTLLLRAEVTALTQLLITKGVATEDEVWEAFAREADFLAEHLSTRFPGVAAAEDGLVLDRRAEQTMRAEGFPP